jgi:CBS domain containing-hemolysin-like protein
LLICLAFAAFFAGLETGMLAVNRALIQERKEKGMLYAKAVEFLLSRPERLLGTTLIGHNIANVTGAVLLTNYFERMGLDSYAWAGILGMTFVFLVFDDFIPKSFFRSHANTLGARLAPVLVGFYALFLPVYLILNNIVKALLFFTGRHRATREELRTRRDLRFVVNLTGKEAGLPVEDQKMIEDILHFREQIAREVMVPFHQLPVLNINQDTVDAVRLSIETGFRFVPVSQHRTDNMIGYVDTTELLWKREQKVQEVMKEADFYPETRSIPDLLLDMNRKNQKVVFLVDEYGGVAGMLTPSQIVADIVHFTPENGTMNDEIVLRDTGEYVVSGSMDLEDLSHELGIAFSRSHTSTIGGYLSERMGVIPEEDQEYREAGYIFTIDRREERHVGRVKIRKDTKTSALEEV